jgi:hypothetical protein
MSTIGSPNPRTEALKEALSDYVRAAQDPKTTTDALEGYYWAQVVKEKAVFLQYKGLSKSEPLYQRAHAIDRPRGGLAFGAPGR